MFLAGRHASPTPATHTTQPKIAGAGALAPAEGVWGASSPPVSVPVFMPLTH